MRPLIFTVCDQEYCDRFAKSFIGSAKDTGNNVKVFCTGMFLLDQKEKNQFLSWRARLLVDLIRTHGAAMWVDIDSVFQHPVEVHHKYNAGLFLREEQVKTKKVLASCFYCSNVGLAEEVRDAIGPEPEWFDDQVALWSIYKRRRDELRFKLFDEEMLTWSADPKSCIFTAKGNRKIKSGDFLQRIEAYQGFGAEEICWDSTGCLQEASHKTGQEKAEADDLRSIA